MEYFILIVLIILIIFMFYFFRNKRESYINTNIYATRLLGAPRFVKLSKYGQIDKVYKSPPLPEVEETKCWALKGCPEWIPPFNVCYRCA